MVQAENALLARRLMGAKGWILNVNALDANLEEVLDYSMLDCQEARKN